MTPKPLAAALAATLLAAGTFVAAQADARQRHVFVNVTGKDGAMVAGLKTSDFQIREDGATREVLGVEPAADPLQIELLLDDSQAAKPVILDLRDAAKGFVDAIHAASADSEIALMSFGDRPTPLVPFTNSPLLLAKGIDQLFGRPGAGATFLQAITEASQALGKKPATRPVIVSFVAEAGPEFSDMTHDRVEAALKDAGASLWPIVLQARASGASLEPGRTALGQTNDPNGPNGQNEIERRYVLDTTSHNSGGARQIVLSETALKAAFTLVASTLTHQYKVTYSRPDELIPPTRLNVKLTTSTKGVTLTAPAWPRR